MGSRTADVLDFVGVWNVAQVLSIPSPNAVRGECEQSGVEIECCY